MAAAQEEKFCLRWNDFEKIISSSFRDLREDKDFFDVTLACDDNQLQAHKVVLSACSPFFRSVLKRNPHQHPLLYLKGVKYENILSVINFMYHGEVNIAQENLNSFLSVAEELQVKGLAQNNSTPDKNAVNAKQTQEKKHSSIKQTRQPPTWHDRQTPQPQPGTLIKTEEPAVLEDERQTQIAVDNNQYQADNEGYEDYYDEQVEDGYGQHHQVQGPRSMTGGCETSWGNEWTSSKVFTCDICFKTFSNKKSFQNHGDSHTGKTTCQICNKVLSTTTNLYQHMRNTHPGYQ